MKRNDLKEIILKLSDGVLETMVDFVLWAVYFQTDILFNPRGRLIWPHVRAADKKLTDINYQTFKDSLRYCQKQGFVVESKREDIKAEITATGRKRLKTILPSYDKNRVWDKRVYLITYDIPEAKRFNRDILREYLKRLGGGMLQQSVWLTPYNPREVLQDFIKERKLQGTIIISDIGSDGFIGDEDIRSLLARLYRLDDLNNRYGQFIKKYQMIKTTSFAQINFAFLSILQDDPQLPFELLPKNWLGEKAYSLFCGRKNW